MTMMAIDANSKPIQCLRPGSTEKISSTGTASSATAISAGVTAVRIIADSSIHYSVTATATTSSVYLPGDSAEFIRVVEGDEISLIGTAAVYITEMQ